MIANIFITATLSCRYIEINDLIIDILSLFECCNEWSNILESGSTNKFRCWILQKSVVNFRKLFSLTFNSCYFCNFCNLISTSLSYFFFTIKSKIIVKWKDMMLEEVEWNYLANIDKISSDSDTNLHILIHSKTLDFWNNKTFTKSLSHVLSKFI